MTRPIRDLAHSVRQRLTNLAKARNRPFAELLQYFAIERFLWRLANSPWRDRFVLKGAIMLMAWRMPMSRPTMDIDLLGRGDNRTTELARIVRELCSASILPADGMVFAPDIGRGRADHRRRRIRRGPHPLPSPPGHRSCAHADRRRVRRCHDRWRSS